MEDLIVNLILLVIFLVIAFVSNFTSAPLLVILGLQFFWPKVSASVQGQAKKTVTQGKVAQYDRDDDTGEYELEFKKRKSTSWFPELRFSYTWNQQHYSKDNQDLWNHRELYSENSTKKTVETLIQASPNFPLKINPLQPQIFFVGLGQFPWFHLLWSLPVSLLFIVVSLKTLLELFPQGLLPELHNPFYWAVSSGIYLLILGFTALRFTLWPRTRQQSQRKKQQRKKQ